MRMASAAKLARIGPKTSGKVPQAKFSGFRYSGPNSANIGVILGGRGHGWTAFERSCDHFDALASSFRVRPAGAPE
jgi:hypothetical protein